MVQLGAVPLNAEQRWAAACLAAGGGARQPFVLFGPPGAYSYPA